MRRFYALREQFTENKVRLSLDESKHLRDVLRLRAGDAVSVFDGDGSEFECSIIETGKNKHPAVLEVLRDASDASRESALDFTLAVALLKGEKFDLVIQKATELGVTRIVPLITRRADVKIKNPDDGAKKLERWRRIVLEAAKQSGRRKLPVVKTPVEFAEFVKTIEGTAFFFSERDGESLANAITDKKNVITAIVGPEGGWEDAEIALARDSRANILTLGGRILRAETAAIAITALMQHLYGDLK